MPTWSKAADPAKPRDTTLAFCARRANALEHHCFVSRRHATRKLWPERRPARNDGSSYAAAEVAGHERAPAVASADSASAAQRCVAVSLDCLSPLRRTALVVRVHNGTSDAMLERHVGWAASLAASPDGRHVHVCLLVDETFGGDVARRKLQTLAAAAGLGNERWTVLPYVEATMEEHFPVLASVRESIPETQDVQDCFKLPHKKSLAWGCHVEAILLWWETVVGTPREPEYAWIVEDDAAYSGDILGFLRVYACDVCPGGHELQEFATPEDDYTCSKCKCAFHSGTSMWGCAACDFDLCTACRSRHISADLLMHDFRNVGSNWVWREVASPEFLRLCPEHGRFRCAEHLQRFSARLLRSLHRYCNQGISAWSEMSVPTLCYVDGLKSCALREEDVGLIFVYNGKVPRKQWAQICEQPHTKDRWWHALKW